MSKIFTTIETISSFAARTLVNSILYCVENDGKPDVSVAVLGTDGRILCLEKSGDHSLLVSDEWAIKKAMTAIAFGRSTKVINEWKPKFNVGDKYCSIPGGILIPSSKWSGWLKNSFETIPENGILAPFSGAIGISGRTSSEDHILAILGLKDFIKQSQF